MSVSLYRPPVARRPTGFLDSCDVGLKYYAIAHFVNGELTDASLIEGVQAVRVPFGCFVADDEWRLVIECATVRQEDGHTKKREVDALNRAAGRLGALHPAPEFKLPEQWKGQLPKATDQKRTVNALTETELGHLPKSKAELKHVLDAVGIGLKALGRR